MPDIYGKKEYKLLIQDSSGQHTSGGRASRGKKHRPPENKESRENKFTYKILIISLVLIIFAAFAVFNVIKENFKKEDDSFILLQKSSTNPSESTRNAAKDYSGADNTNEGEGGKENHEGFPVYITGQVKSPGIYTLKKASYLYEVVDLAGGFTPEADSDYINLVFLIEESMMIRIPAKMEKLTDNLMGGYTEQIDASSLRAFSVEKEISDFPIDINKADIDQLCMLPGVGPATAEAIIRHRDEYGKFKRIEDIMNVSGIKENKFNSLKDKIIVSP